MIKLIKGYKSPFKINNMNKKPVTLTLSPDIIDQGKEQAKKEQRSFSNYIEYLISEDKKRLELLNSNPY